MPPHALILGGVDSYLSDQDRVDPHQRRRFGAEPVAGQGVRPGMTGPGGTQHVGELTQLSLRHYKSARTGAVVPLLHVAPSKNDTERLIPISPELVAVLLEVLRRGTDSSRPENGTGSARSQPSSNRSNTYTVAARE